MPSRVLGHNNSSRPYEFGSFSAHANASRSYWPGPETNDQGRVIFPALIPGATYRLSKYEDGKPKVLKLFTVKSGEHLDLGEFEIEFNN